jgi:hypothetical protein
VPDAPTLDWTVHGAAVAVCAAAVLGGEPPRKP